MPWSLGVLVVKGKIPAIDPLIHWIIDSLKGTRQGPFNESTDQRFNESIEELLG
jgi:hypothetical protein